MFRSYDHLQVEIYTSEINMTDLKSRHYLKDLRKLTEVTIQDGQSSGRDVKTGPPKHGGRLFNRPQSLGGDAWLAFLGFKCRTSPYTEVCLAKRSLDQNTDVWFKPRSEDRLSCLRLSIGSAWRLNRLRRTWGGHFELAHNSFRSFLPAQFNSIYSAYPPRWACKMTAF
jgi:hypothetical protein